MDLKKLSGLNTLLSGIITGYIFWILFIFNPRFNATDSIHPMAKAYEYALSGGNLHYTILLILSITLGISFIIYANKDSKSLEIYNDRVNPLDFQEKNNLFSNKRKLQYAVLIMLIVEISLLLIRMNTLNHDVDYISIFNKDGFFIFGIEFILVYLIIFTCSLILEMIHIFKS